jgi:hypothetical protein
VEGAEQSGGLHKGSAEAWGNSLRARGAELPLGALVLAFTQASQPDRLAYHAHYVKRLTRPEQRVEAPSILKRSVSEFGVYGNRGSFLATSTF